MDLTAGAIAELVNGVAEGDPSARLTGINPIRDARSGDLSFIGDTRYVHYLAGTKATAVIIARDAPAAVTSAVLIRVDNPHETFLSLAVRFFAPPDRAPKGVHPTAVIENGAVIGEGAALGAHAFVGAGSRIGGNVVIYPNVYIGNDCEIGDDVILYPNVTIREDTHLGDRCILHPGVVIGGDGFGFVYKDGRHVKVPQMGAVWIGDDVEIGANSTVDRATFGQTRIGSGTKIDNLVQIGHNSSLGEHCIACGASGVAGSAMIGDYVTLAAGCGVGGHIEIGDRVTVAGFSGVTKSIPAGLTVSGFPAIEHSSEQRIQASVRRLPDALRKLRDLENRINQLESRPHGREAENDN